MNKFIEIIKHWFLNKYVLTLLIFAVVLTFCGPHSLINRAQNKKKINNLERQIESYEKNIEINNRKINELESNQENLEKFAREQYLMKEDGEDIYLIDEKD